MDRTRIEKLVQDIQATLKGLSPLMQQGEKIAAAVDVVSRSWSRSTLGHHAEIYYMDFQRPPYPFNAEWGTQNGMPRGWFTATYEEVEQELARLSGVDLRRWKSDYQTALTQLAEDKDALLVELPPASHFDDEKYERLISKLESADFDGTFANEHARKQMNAYRASISRDVRAISAGGASLPAHLQYDSLVAGLRHATENASALVKNTTLLLRHIQVNHESAAAKSKVEVHRMFDDMMTDTLTLHGHTFQGLVTSGKITTFESSLKVEEGDIIERAIENGRTEQYEVTDTGFVSSKLGIQAHYQMKVRKVTGRIATMQASAPAPVTHIYNVHGPNARINNQSVDQSQNVVGVNEAELFEKLKEAIRASVAETTQQQQLLHAIEEMAANTGKATFSEKFQQFMGFAANCMTVVTPFLPALAALAASAH